MDNVSFISLISLFHPNKYFRKREPLGLENQVKMKEVDDRVGSQVYTCIKAAFHIFSILKATEIVIKVVAEVDISIRTMIPLMRKGFMFPQTQVSNDIT